MKIGDKIMLTTEKHWGFPVWRITGIDVYGPMAARFKCYSLESSMGQFRLTEREMALNGARQV